MILNYNGRHGYFAGGEPIARHQAFLVRIGERMHIAVPHAVIDGVMDMTLLKWDGGCPP
jgi:hypothetical protein